MQVRLMAFLVWGLLGCSAAYWLLQLLVTPVAMPAQALPLSDRPGSQADLTRLFGAAPAAAAEALPLADSRFKLLGLVAPKNPKTSLAGEGVALIAVDGVARTMRIGATLEGDVQLLALDSRSASLGRGGVISMVLQLAKPDVAATGSLSPAAPSPLNLGGINPPGMPPRSNPSVINRVSSQ